MSVGSIKNDLKCSNPKSIYQVKKLLESVTSDMLVNGDDLKTLTQADKKLEELIQTSRGTHKSSLLELQGKIYSLKYRLETQLQANPQDHTSPFALAIDPSRFKTDHIDPILQGLELLLKSCEEKKSILPSETPLPSPVTAQVQGSTPVGRPEMKTVGDAIASIDAIQARSRLTGTRLETLEDAIGHLDKVLAIFGDDSKTPDKKLYDSYGALGNSFFQFQRILGERKFDPATRAELEAILLQFQATKEILNAAKFSNFGEDSQKILARTINSYKESLEEVKRVLEKHKDKTPLACTEDKKPKLNRQTKEKECPVSEVVRKPFRKKRALGGQ